MELLCKVNVLCRGPTVDAYGFERSADFDYKSYDEFMSRYVHVLARRAGRWATLLDGNEQLAVTDKCNSLFLCTLFSYSILPTRNSCTLYSELLKMSLALFVVYGPYSCMLAMSTKCY